MEEVILFDNLKEKVGSAIIEIVGKNYFTFSTRGFRQQFIRIVNMNYVKNKTNLIII